MMNSVRTGDRSGWDGVINEPTNVGIEKPSLPPKDLRRSHGNHSQNLINDSWVVDVNVVETSTMKHILGCTFVGLVAGFGVLGLSGIATRWGGAA